MARSWPAPEEPLQAKERGRRSQVSVYTVQGQADTHTLCPHPTGEVTRTNCADRSDSVLLFPGINRIPRLSSPQRQKPVNNAGSLLLTQLSPGTLAPKQPLLLSKHVPLPPTSCPGGSRILHRLTFAAAPGAE